MNRVVIYEWPGVTEVQETADSVDLFSRDGCVVVVRDRAFPTATDRNKFLELARTYLNTNRS